MAVQRMLITAAVSPIDLLRAWDRSTSGTGGDGKLEKHELTSHVKRVVDDEDLWRSQLREVAVEAFEEISAGDGAIDTSEVRPHHMACPSRLLSLSPS